MQASPYSQNGVQVDIASVEYRHDPTTGSTSYGQGGGSVTRTPIRLVPPAEPNTSTVATVSSKSGVESKPAYGRSDPESPQAGTIARIATPSGYATRMPRCYPTSRYTPTTPITSNSWSVDHGVL